MDRLFFVNTGVERNNEREWDWCRNYGFVGAGGVNPQGRRGYAEGLRKRLQPGDLVLAYLSRNKNPHGGYVGLGEVTGKAVRARDFRLPGGRPLKEVLPADHPWWRKPPPPEDEDEWLVRVCWLHARPAEEALWEAGLFAPRNVVARMDPKNPRVARTLEFLAPSFPALAEL